MSLIRTNSSWNQQTIAAFLRATVIPVRLACTDSGGAPLICSLWYVYQDDAIWCATQQSANIVTLLERQPQCGFEIAPDSMPYRGVRGQGRVTLLIEEGPGLLLQLIDRYLGDRDSGFSKWLIEKSSTEVAIKIEPDWLTSWDFSKRMQT